MVQMEWTMTGEMAMPSKSKKEAKLMAACSHGADYPSCPPVSVAKEFNQADKRAGNLKRGSKLPLRVKRGR